MQNTIEMLAEHVRSLIEEVNELRAQNEFLTAELQQRDQEAGLNKLETQEAVEKLDELIGLIEQAQKSVQQPSMQQQQPVVQPQINY